MILQASPDRLAQDLAVLARDIGVRLAGTPSERAAADYIIGRARLTRAHVWEEPFPMRARVVSEEQLEVLIGGSWHRIRARSSAARQGPTATGGPARSRR
jgi:aminopeptidase YwaD